VKGMLENTYRSNEFKFVFMPEERGNERIEEIKEFIKGKKEIYFSAIDFGVERNIKRLEAQLRDIFGKQDENSDIVDYLIEVSKKERILIIINDIHNLIAKEYVEKISQSLSRLKEANIMIVALSKSIVFSKWLLQSELSKYITLFPLPQKSIFDESYGISVNKYDKFVYYSMFGGIEKYISCIDQTKTLKENMLNTVLNKDSIFMEEPKCILKEDLREPQVYNLILETIAKGANTLNEISDVMNMPTSICNKYITVLISLGIVDKIKPVFEEDTRKSKYEIHNSMLNFWYFFIPENINDISLGREDKVYEMKVSQQLNSFLAPRFRKICREYLLKKVDNKKIQIQIKEDGMWWNRKNEIDIVIGNGKDAIVADTYWSENEIGKEALKDLEDKASNLDIIEKKYYLFSKAGFTQELKRNAIEREDVVLISFDGMFENNIEKEKNKKRFFFSRK
jgi:predicted transcriptional regulator/peroxiredoxin